MIYRLNTIQLKKVYPVIIIGPFIIVGFSIGISLLLESVIGIISLLALLPFVGIISFNRAKQRTVINTDDDKVLIINLQEIPYNNIIGYHIDNNSLGTYSLILKQYDNKIISLHFPRFGKHRNDYHIAITDVIQKIKNMNTDVKELEYSEMYVTEFNYLRYLIIVMIVLVLVLDILGVYYIIIGNDIPWQLFLINFVLLGFGSGIKTKNT